MPNEERREPLDEFGFSRLRRHDFPETHTISSGVRDKIARAQEDARPVRIEDERMFVLARTVGILCDAVFDLEARIVDLEARLDGE